MAAVAFTLSALATELLADPASLGYSAAVAAGDDNAVFALINTSRAGGEYQQDRDAVTPDQLFAVLDPTEFSLVTATGLARLQTVLSLPLIDLAVSNIKAMMDAIFPLAGATQQALAVLQKRQGSRAEALFGRGFIVTVNHIGQAV